VATCLENLAKVHQSQGDFTAARPLHERALAILEQAFGPDDPAVAATLNNLALLLADPVIPPGARALSERALKIIEKDRSPEHLIGRPRGTTWARCSRHRVSMRTRVSSFERALELRKASLGAEHPAVAETLSNLLVLAWTRAMRPRHLPSSLPASRAFVPA